MGFDHKDPASRWRQRGPLSAQAPNSPWHEMNTTEGWSESSGPMNQIPINRVLDAWNRADQSFARSAMLACCGATRWADAMVAARPLADIAVLSETADRLWASMGEADWLEAFAWHPRIG